MHLDVMVFLGACMLFQLCGMPMTSLHQDDTPQLYADALVHELPTCYTVNLAKWSSLDQ